MASAVCMVTALSGCGTAADGGGAFSTSGLINDIAHRLAESETLTYTATFSQGVSVAHAQDPTRTAYTYPGGVVLILSGAATSCATIKAKTTCKTSAPGAAGSTVTPAVDNTIEHAGLVRTEKVISMLTQISLNADAIISEQDRTLAGTNATCITITGVPADERFSACVTDDGLLGSFTGAVAGTPIDLELSHFVMSTEVNAFVLPRAA